MSAFIHPVLRRGLRLRACCSLNGTVSEAVSSRPSQCSHSVAREAPGLTSLANVGATVSRVFALDRNSLFSSLRTEYCHPPSFPSRQLRPAICHHLFGHRRLLSCKLKPLSSWKRRFQMTSNGKYLRKQKGERHKSFSKSRKRRLRLRASKLIHSSSLSPLKKMGFALR